MSEIVVVGSLNMDLIVRTPRLPRPGETVVGHGFSMAPGGKGANQAIAGARLGARMLIVGRVGADEFGRSLRHNLRAAGVHDVFVVTDEAAATGVALIAVEDSSQNSIVVTAGANAHVSRRDVEAARSAIVSGRALVTQLEVPLEAVTCALRVAHAAHVLTVLNPAPARPLPTDLFTLVDILVPNETEASVLTGTHVQDRESAEAAARELHRRGAQAVVITLGTEGALAYAEGRVHLVPAFAVKAVDATGAGDAFVAALTVARVRGLDWDAALGEASAAGALATTRLGAQPSLPTRAELIAFLEATQR